MASASRAFSGRERAGDIQDQVAHRVGRPRAVVEQLLVGQVFGDGLVLLEGRDQRLERLDRDRGNARRSRPARSSPGGVARPWIHRPQLARATSEQLE